jgi:hypothetical protein
MFAVMLRVEAEYVVKGKYLLWHVRALFVINVQILFGVQHYI